MRCSPQPPLKLLWHKHKRITAQRKLLQRPELQALPLSSCRCHIDDQEIQVTAHRCVAATIAAKNTHLPQ